MVGTAKRILTKEKIDRQLAGQSSSTPFMSIEDNNKRVKFDMQDGLEEKIDRCTVMMSKLAANEGTNKQFKPKMFQSKRRGQMRNFYDKCNNKETIKIGIDQIVEIGECSMDKITEVGQGMNKATGMTLEKETYR